MHLLAFLTFEGFSAVPTVRFKLHQNVPFSVLDFKMFSAVPTFSEKEIPGGPTRPFSYFELTFCCPRYAPGNSLCKNAPKMVEATNMFDSDDKSVFHAII